MADLNTHYVSGEPNTTGREPFEDEGRLGNVGAGSNNQQLSGGIGSVGSGRTGGTGQDLTGSTGGVGVGSGAGLGSSGDTSYGEGHRDIAPGAAHSHGATGQGSTHGQGHGQDYSSSGGAPVGTATGTGASQAVGGEHHGHHHHGHHTDSVPGPGSTKPTGEGYGGIGAADTGSHVDRVGPQGQGQAAYERTSGDGPATRGAAGTDRFDTGPAGASHGSAEGQDTSQRAPGKSSGGVGGVLGTSDKDFTGRERQGGTMGAYADSHGPVEGNTSGPKGHTALTGREGNLDENPVAQAKSRETGSTTTATGSSNAGHEGEHKGFMDKVKDAFKS